MAGLIQAQIELIGMIAIIMGDPFFGKIKDLGVIFEQTPIPQ